MQFSVFLGVLAALGVLALIFGCLFAGSKGGRRKERKVESFDDWVA